jgi:hypothetical protein
MDCVQAHCAMAANSAQANTGLTRAHTFDSTRWCTHALPGRTHHVGDVHEEHAVVADGNRAPALRHFRVVQVVGFDKGRVHDGPACLCLTKVDQAVP